MDHHSHAHHAEASAASAASASSAVSAASASSADDWSAMADLLDLDGEVLHAYLAEAMAWVRQAAAGRQVRRILDVGSGTGNGALALAGHFPGAEVIAVDESGDLLARLRAKARDLGLADRVQ